MHLVLCSRSSGTRSWWCWRRGYVAFLRRADEKAGGGSATTDHGLHAHKLPRRYAVDFHYALRRRGGHTRRTPGRVRLLFVGSTPTRAYLRPKQGCPWADSTARRGISELWPYYLLVSSQWSGGARSEVEVTVVRSPVSSLVSRPTIASRTRRSCPSPEAGPGP
jgi:hypothetical protein